MNSLKESILADIEDTLDKGDYLEEIPFITNINRKLYKNWNSINLDKIKSCPAAKDCFGNTLKIGDFVLFPYQSTDWNQIRFLSVGIITALYDNKAVVYISTMNGEDSSDPDAEAFTNDYYCCSLLRITKNSVKKYKLQ